MGRKLNELVVGSRRLARHVDKLRSDTYCHTLLVLKIHVANTAI